MAAASASGLRTRVLSAEPVNRAVETFRGSLDRGGAVGAGVSVDQALAEDGADKDGDQRNEQKNTTVHSCLRQFLFREQADSVAVRVTRDQ